MKEITIIVTLALSLSTVSWIKIYQLEDHINILAKQLIAQRYTIDILTQEIRK